MRRHSSHLDGRMAGDQRGMSVSRQWHGMALWRPPRPARPDTKCAPRPQQPYPGEENTKGLQLRSHYLMERGLIIVTELFVLKILNKCVFLEHLGMRLKFGSSTEAKGKDMPTWYRVILVHIISNATKMAAGRGQGCGGWETAVLY